MRHHGRDHDGVANLTPSKRTAAAELHELIRAVFEDGKSLYECGSVRGGVGEGESLSPNLLSRHNGEILAQDLSADRERFAGGKPRESDAASVTEGAERRREEPSPGARPHPAGAADQEGPRRHHDP